MGSFISKQPNGLYCRFSKVADCPTEWNMTAEDYIELCKKEAEEEAKYILANNLRDFSLVKECFCPNNMTRHEFEHFLNDVNKDYEKLR